MTPESFLTDRLAKEAFKQSIRESIGIPRAAVGIRNATLIAVPSSSAAKNTKIGDQAIQLLDFITKVDYNITFYTTDIAPLASKTEAFVAVTTRLNQSVSTGQFTTILQSVAVQQNVTVLLTTTSPPEGLIVSKNFLTVFVHSAFPTTLPTNQPSSWGTLTSAGWTQTKVARTLLYIAGPIRWDGGTPAEQSPTTYNQPKYALNEPSSLQSNGLITSLPTRAPPCLNFLVFT